MKIYKKKCRVLWKAERKKGLKIEPDLENNWNFSFSVYEIFEARRMVGDLAKNGGKARVKVLRPKL